MFFYYSNSDNGKGNRTRYKLRNKQRKLHEKRQPRRDSSVHYQRSSHIQEEFDDEGYDERYAQARSSNMGDSAKRSRMSMS